MSRCQGGSSGRSDEASRYAIWSEVIRRDRPLRSRLVLGRCALSEFHDERTSRAGHAASRATICARPRWALLGAWFILRSRS